MLRLPRPVRRSFVAEVLDSGAGRLLQDRWMLLQTDDVRESLRRAGPAAARRAGRSGGVAAAPGPGHPRVLCRRGSRRRGSARRELTTPLAGRFHRATRRRPGQATARTGQQTPRSAQEPIPASRPRRGEIDYGSCTAKLCWRWNTPRGLSRCASVTAASYVLAAQPGQVAGAAKQTSPRSKRIVQTGLPGCVLPESPCPRSPDRKVNAGQQPSVADFHAPTSRRLDQRATRFRLRV
jgi:hypothetical protein